MLDFLNDNIFVMFGGRVMHTVSIPMGTNYASFLAIYSFIRMKLVIVFYKFLYPEKFTLF